MFVCQIFSFKAFKNIFYLFSAQNKTNIKMVISSQTSAWMLLFCSNAADRRVFSWRKSTLDNPEHRRLCCGLIVYDLHADNTGQPCMCCTQSFNLHLPQLRGQRDAANIAKLLQSTRRRKGFRSNLLHLLLVTFTRNH